jgi:SAM-dependent methyltransferase
LHTDNGFATRAAMEAAHRPIVDLAVAALAGRRGQVVDLGCGNGVLVRRVCAAALGLVPVGIDADPERIAHARELAPSHSADFVVGDLCDADRLLPGARFALALLQPGRLLEVDGAAAKRLRAWLRRRCPTVVLYAYPDTLAAHGGLAALARRAGFTRLSQTIEGVGLAVWTRETLAVKAGEA